jgi:hypothetical protein
MSRRLTEIAQTKDIAVDFGKRFSFYDSRPTPAVQETCVRCCGTGRIRERGNRIICKACAGTGRLAVITDRAS